MNTTNYTLVFRYNRARKGEIHVRTFLPNVILHWRRMARRGRQIRWLYWGGRFASRKEILQLNLWLQATAEQWSAPHKVQSDPFALADLMEVILGWKPRGKDPLEGWFHWGAGGQ